MTDNEIIKALECCPYYDVCLNCPCFSFCGCTPEVFENALSLINRQKAEIERLRGEFVFLGRQNGKTEIIYQMIKTSFAEIRAEAIKEFADLAIKKICENVTPIPQQRYLVKMCIEEIENTKKEMVGDTDV